MVEFLFGQNGLLAGLLQRYLLVTYSSKPGMTVTGFLLKRLSTCKPMCVCAGLHAACSVASTHFCIGTARFAFNFVWLTLYSTSI